MSRLSYVGVVGYNGFRFPAPMNVKVSGIGIPDSSGRTYKAYSWRVNVTGILVSEDGPVDFTAGQSYDSRMDALRCRLTKPGRELVFTGQGFGPLVVNSGQTDWASLRPAGVPNQGLDSQFGPKPTLALWEPVGSTHAVRIDWTCETTVPECCSNEVFKDALLQYNYSVSFGINTSGMTTRTVSGILEIPMTRAGANDNVPPDSVDAYRNEIEFDRIDGFERTQNFNISEDKRILNFTIVDTEIPSDNAYFPGMVRMDINQNASSSLGGFKQWNNTIRGTVTVAPGVSKIFAWNAFFHCVFSRWAFRDKGQLIVPQQGKQKSKMILISALSIDEQIFGRTLNFSVSYLIASDLKTVMAACGFGQLVEGDWTKWKTSLEDVQGLRGYTKLGHSIRDHKVDLIIDLCNPKPIPTTFNKGKKKEKSPGKDQDDISLDYEKNSWIFCENKFTFRVETAMVVHVTLPKNKTEAQEEINSTQETGSASTTNVLPIHITPNYRPNTRIQAPTRKAFYVTMTGSATRADIAVPVPELVKIGGMTPFVFGTPVVASKITKNLDGRSIHSSTWKKQYCLLLPPTFDANDITKQTEVEGIPKHCTKQ